MTENLPMEQSDSLLSPEQQRVVAQVQGQMVIAKKFPRDEEKARAKILKSCERKSLAESSLYEYVRGGSKVEGPSIRLAEAIVQNWPNFECGVNEVEQRDGESVMEAFAWDIENNSRIVKNFTVKHGRFSRKKGFTKVMDPRDIYEVGANAGARRLRACILGMIPGDIVDDAVAQCKKTLIGDTSQTLEQRLNAMLEKFKAIGVDTKMIEIKLGHKIDATTVNEVVKLGSVFRSISDEMATVDDFFKKEPETIKTEFSEVETEQVTDQVTEQAEPKPEKSETEPDGDEYQDPEVPY